MTIPPNDEAERQRQIDGLYAVALIIVCAIGGIVACLGSVWMIWINR
jgi:hypothetical protein